MIKKLLDWFTKTPEVLGIVPPPEPEPQLTNGELIRAIEKLHACTWVLKDKTPKHWVKIPPVVVTETFGGWGFVSGRTEALKINDRIHITEADDDMDFSEYCVLVDNMPCLLLIRKGGNLLVAIIATRDFIDEVFNTHAMRLNSFEDFAKLPAPVQKIMHDVLQKVLEIRDEIEQDSAVEKMLTY